nr:HAD family phosphatase [Propionibacteriales bacterium]
MTAPSPGNATGRSAWPRLIALDIDGTLVDRYEEMTPAVEKAVHAARDAGAHIVLSTGRSVFGIDPIIDALGLESGHCVASNGAVTFTYPPVEITSAVTFDPDPAVRMVLAKVPEALVAIEVIGRGFRTNRLFPDGEITGEMWIESVDDLVREPVTRVIIRDPDSSAEDFMALASTLGLQGTNYFVGYTAWLDLVPKGVSKAFGLAKVAAALDVAQADV